jgi:Ca2+-binding EF-hand superfamily protein
MSIASDEYFVRMMEATWACWEDDEDAAQCDKTVRQLLGELRSRVKKQAGGDSARLRKQFVDYDINASGAITIDECTTMLQKLGISVERKWVHPMFRAIDRDNSGSIEFEEFEAFVNDN